MMRIHTTQNLNTLDKNQLSTNAKDFRLKSNYSYYSERISDNISFNAGKPSKPIDDIIPRISKRIKDTTSKRASDKKNLSERILSSDRFNNILGSILENEVLSNAGIAFLIGWTCRVPTILALPEWLGGKHKEDKAMAAAHSGASVTMGVITAALLTLPINKGAKHAREKLYKHLNEELLKKRHPQLDIKSIKDSAGNLLDVKFWKNTDGKKFSQNIKTPMTVARPKYAGDIAESTYKAMGIDIDMTANANKALTEMTLRDGRRLVDVLTPKDMFIAIEEEGMGTTLKGLKDTNFFSLEYIDKEFLSKAMPELDINTAFVDGKITHPSTWKTTKGESAFNFDVYISNYLETAESTPIYTGVKRIEGNGTKKYAAYQDNGDGGLGTLITNEMIAADKNIDTVNKTIGWAIEVLTRIPVGLCTVALIPKILNLFNTLDNVKSAKKANGAAESVKVEENIEKIEDKVAEDNIESEVVLKDEKDNKKQANELSFKGKGTPKEPGKFVKWLGKNYAFKMMNSTKLQRFVENFDKNVDMSMTEVMTILGSFLMSSGYVTGTLTNKNFKDKDRRNTLAINQALGFIIPTFLGAYVSKKVNPHVKKVTYKFVGEQSQRIKLLAQSGKLTKEAEEKALNNVAKVSKGISVLASLTVFTFIYRYFTPVAVTPIANWLGNMYNDRKKANKPQELSNDKADIGKEMSEKLKESNEIKETETAVA